MSLHLLCISRALMSKALQNVCTKWNEPDDRCLWNPYYLDSNHAPLPRFLVVIGRDLMFKKSFNFWPPCDSSTNTSYVDLDPRSIILNAKMLAQPLQIFWKEVSKKPEKKLTFHICLSHALGCCDVAGASPLHNSWTGVAVQVQWSSKISKSTVSFHSYTEKPYIFLEDSLAFMDPYSSMCT